MKDITSLIEMAKGFGADDVKVLADTIFDILRNAMKGI